MPELYDDGTESSGLKENGKRITPSVHLVSEYGFMSFEAALDLPCDEFKSLLRNALISKYASTEKGRKQLEVWRRCQNTELQEDNIDFFRKL